MSRISELVDRIQGVRDYTVSLVDAVPESEWFRQPAEGVTHVAWQVGHLAMAQYRLALDRVRGVQPGDEDLISEQVLSIYGKDSVPDPDP
ncbi:MAG TPA: DinB family protein, partial [Planctomycetaceae bacterium]|nr:DinB family protein [Planctomycetaceae bacterium]